VAERDDLFTASIEEADAGGGGFAGGCIGDAASEGLAIGLAGGRWCQCRQFGDLFEKPPSSCHNANRTIRRPFGVRILLKRCKADDAKTE